MNKLFGTPKSNPVLMCVFGLCLGGGMLLAQDQPPVITQHPQSQIVALGGEARFTVQLEPNPLTPAYQWYKAGISIAKATNDTLVVSKVGTASLGPYTVAVTNLAGTVTSELARLTVLADTSTPGSLGARIILAYTSYGLAPATRQWRLDGNNLPDATNAVYVIDKAQLADVGQYSLAVSNAYGTFDFMLRSNVVDPTFTKILPPEPIVADNQASSSGTWWDIDQDGFLDLLVAQANLAFSNPSTNVLYRNNGDNTFSKVSTNAIVQVLGKCDSGTVGDFNNDGFIDLFIANHFGVDSLFRNEGAGLFTRLTPAECGPPVSDNDKSFDATWVDYDCDGFLDLFTVNGGYSVGKCLYRNRGDGTFVKMSAGQAGSIATDPVVAWGCCWADFDADGYPDVWLPNSNGRQLLYRNVGDGTFSRTTAGSVPAEGAVTGSGLWADYDNDGLPDLFATGGASFFGAITDNALHRNLGGHGFTNVLASAGVVARCDAIFGAWGDYDNDGYLDLFLTAVSMPDARNNSLLYRNNGDGTFSSVDVGSPMIDGEIRLGTVWADYNNDGFLDLFIACGLLTQGPRPNLLYQNNGNGNAWLKLNLVGIASNRSAIGAKVRVKATIGGKSFWQLRELTGNTGLSGGHGLIPHFGLGDASSVERVRIEWPSGIVQELENVPVRQTLTVVEHQDGATTPPLLTASRLASGTVELALTGQTNLRYAFEASSDLAQWTKIGVRTNLTGTVEFTDTLAAKYAQRFYRASAP